MLVLMAIAPNDLAGGWGFELALVNSQLAVNNNSFNLVVENKNQVGLIALVDKASLFNVEFLGGLMGNLVDGFGDWVVWLLIG